MRLNKIDKEQRLFVIDEGKGFSCLGFDVVAERSRKLSKELDDIALPQTVGSVEALCEYERLIEGARRKNVATGWRSSSELTPELIGLEGKRVEVITEWGEKKRFYVGKSTGFIPCHLEIKRRNSSGGSAVCIGKPQSVRVIGSRHAYC